MFVQGGGMGGGGLGGLMISSVMSLTGGTEPDPLQSGKHSSTHYSCSYTTYRCTMYACKRTYIAHIP